MNSRGIFFRSIPTPVLRVTIYPPMIYSEMFLHLFKADRFFIPAPGHHRQIMEILLEFFILLHGKNHCNPVPFFVHHISFSCIHINLVLYTHAGDKIVVRTGKVFRQGATVICKFYRGGQSPATLPSFQTQESHISGQMIFLYEPCECPSDHV